MITKMRNPAWNLLLLIPLLIGACDSKEQITVESDRDNTQEVLDYYASQPDFFSFKTINDLPAGLNWENGSELAEFSSKDARKGGTQYSSIDDFPRTLRHVGPDSNGSFRRWILDYFSMSAAHIYPNDSNQFFPGLATSWAVSPEHRTTYIRLNPDARWSDGEKVTADD